MEIKAPRYTFHFLKRMLYCLTKNIFGYAVLCITLSFHKSFKFVQKRLTVAIILTRPRPTLYGQFSQIPPQKRPSGDTAVSPVSPEQWNRGTFSAREGSTEDQDRNVQWTMGRVLSPKRFLSDSISFIAPIKNFRNNSNIHQRNNITRNIKSALGRFLLF